MKTFSRPMRFFAIVVILAMTAYLCANGSAVETKTRTNMDPLTPRLQSIFAKVKTVCVGRYLIDVPATAEVVYGPGRVPFDIRRMPGKADAMPELIASRLTEIEHEKEYAYGPLKANNTMIGKVIDGEATGQKIVFGVSKASGGFYNIQSYIKVSNDLYVQKTQSAAGKDVYGESVRKLNLVAKNLRARAESAVPVEPGMCIDGAIVLELPEALQEQVTIGIRLREIPDVHVSLSMTKKDRVVESDALAPRIAEAERQAERVGARGWFSRIKVLRRGDRRVEGWAGYEVLVRKPAQKSEGESHEFVFLSQGEPKNPFRPVLDIRLDTGVEDNRTGAKPPGVTDDEAIKIWDHLISTIRVRPTGNLKTTRVASEPEASIGLLTKAGAACPANGWWRCTDSSDRLDVSGGRVQYFRAGERMPQALLLPATTPWQKLHREQPSFYSNSPSSWELVDRRRNPRSPSSILLAPAVASPLLGSVEITKDRTEMFDHEGVALGIELVSSDVCTASGWWQCLEPGAVDSARWFAYGALLPAATKPALLTVLEKIKGAPEFVRVPTAWRLIRFDDSGKAVSAHAGTDSAASSDGVSTDGSTRTGDV